MESTEGDETEALIVPSSCNVTDYQSTNNNDKKDGAPLTLDQAVEMIGFGRFQIWMLMVFGWCRLADALGNLAPSYIMPKVSCEFEASDLELSLFPSTGLAGILVGSFVWGSIADIKGRIPVLVLCEIINTLFAIGASTSQSLWFLTVMRFFWGVGLGGSVCVTSTYVIEFLPIKNRGRYMLTLPGSFSMGLLLIAGLAWLIIPHEEWTWYIQGYTFNSWRLFLLVTAVPAIVSIPLLLTLPESPRYLVQVNKIRKAKTILQYVYKKNKKIPLSQVNFALQRVAASNSTRRELKKFSNITKNILSIITTPEMRKRFVVSSIILSSLAFSNFGLTLWFPTMIERMDESNATSVCGASIAPSNKTKCDNSDQTPVYIDTFIQAAANIPGHLVYLLLIDTVGRKLLLGASMILNAVSVFFIWFVSSPTGSIVMSCVFTALSRLSGDVAHLVNAELFPTKIRSTAMGLQKAVFEQISSILAIVLMGALLSVHCAIPILLIAALLLIGGVLSYKLPNTTNAAIN